MNAVSHVMKMDDDYHKRYHATEGKKYIIKFRRRIF
jgi:hypothetical protein